MSKHTRWVHSPCAKFVLWVTLLHWCGLSVAQLPVPCGGGACAGGPNTWVTSGAASSAITGNQLNINQHTDKATLNWQSFDIGAANAVNFNQPDVNSVALNRIYQNSASEILGALRANGQIYLINQNGILFGDGAQVDVHSLVASTLDISDEVFETLGLTNAINETVALPAFAHGDELIPMGEIKIDPGATIKTKEGGRVMMFAPKITNAGEISTPGGQAILAAAQDEVYLAVSNDPDIRGLLVGVKTGGEIENLGNIIAERGNVSLLGLAVNQSGVARATSTVTINGTVSLLAQDTADFPGSQGSRVPVGNRGGEVTLGADSVTEVLPELSGAETALDAQEQPQSRIDLYGQSVTVEDRARISAPGGDIGIIATSAPTNKSPGSNVQDAPDSFVAIGDDVVIDAAGTRSAVVAMERNVVEVEARGNELRDAPLQRDGPLRGQKLYVDVRDGSPLLDISGALNNVKRDVAERTSVGGSVTITSQGAIDVAASAVVDVSGGTVTYQDGYLATSKLLSDGRIVDIADADPNVPYDGILGTVTVRHEKWGLVETFDVFSTASLARFEAGYVEGKDAGTLNLNGRSINFLGNVKGDVVAGTRQINKPAAEAAGLARPFDQVPLGALLNLNYHSSQALQLPTVALSSGDAIRTSQDAVLTLPPQWLQANRIARLQIATPGRLDLPSESRMELPAFGEFSATASAMNIGGQIIAPGGKVSAKATFDAQAAFESDIQLDQFTEIDLSLGERALIDVSGRWINDRLAVLGASQLESRVLDGGTIALSASGDLTLAAGSRLAANGGAAVSESSRFTGGKGGGIDLSSSSSFGATSLILGGAIEAYALDSGGSLSLKSNAFRIDAAPAEMRAGVTHLAPGFFQQGGFSRYSLSANAGGVELAADTALSLQAVNLLPRVDTFAEASASDLTAVTEVGTLPEYLRRPVHLTLKSTATGDAAFLGNYPGDLQPGIRVAGGASVAGDVKSNLQLISDTSIVIDGRLETRAGDIQLSIEAPQSSNLKNGYRADQMIWLGPSAVLAADGTVVMRPDALGRRLGDVYRGGAISLDAKQGSVVLSPGSTIHANGVAAVFDLPANRSGGALDTAATRVHASAGTINLRAAETLLPFGDLQARGADVEGAAGGSLRVALDPTQRDDSNDIPEQPNFPFSARSLVLSSDSEWPEFAEALQNVAAEQAIPVELNGLALVSASTLQSGGFDRIELAVRPTKRNTGQASDPALIRFDSSLGVSARSSLIFDAPLLSGADGTAVQLSAPYVRLGSDLTGSTLQFLDVASVSGSAQLRIAAQPSDGAVETAALLEIVGDVTLSGFGGRDNDGVDTGGGALLLSSGDMRLRGDRAAGSLDIEGSLRSAGNLRLEAQQVYATTLTEFDIELAPNPGTILAIAAAPGVSAASAPPAPLSAGSQLRLSAPVIRQQGVLRAPFGSLVLTASEQLVLANNSLTSVSGAGLLVPYGQAQFGETLVFPFESNLLKVVETAPERNIALQSPDVAIETLARLDVGGGGELGSFEFIPGPGGSRDVLAPGALSGAFAVLPQLGETFAPFDPLASATAAPGVGDTIYIADGVDGLPAGVYAKLPARYALYGGYLVEPTKTAVAPLPGDGLARSDGLQVVAAKGGVAGTSTFDAQWHAYTVSNGAQLRERAEYLELNTDQLLSAGLASADAGTLSIAAGEALRLAGSLVPNSGSGRGAQVDIAAPSLRVVNALTEASDAEASDVVELTSGDLRSLGAASLALGVRRRDDIDAEGLFTSLDVISRDLAIADNVTIEVPELLLAATENLVVAEGATLTASGSGTAGEQRMRLPAGAALMRLSTSRGGEITREESFGGGANLTVSSGANLQAAGSVVLDADGDLTMGGVFDAGGTATLAANRISLGETAGVESGLVLDNEALSRLAGVDLVLRSRDSIDFYGDTVAQFGSVTLDAVRLAAASLPADDLGGVESAVPTPTHVSLSATTLTLRNSGTAAARPDSATGESTFSAQVDQLRLAGGELALEGFGTVNVTAVQQVALAADGALHAAGNLNVTTPRLVAGRQATVEVTSGGVMNIGGGLAATTDRATVAEDAVLGAALNLQAAAVSLDTEVFLPAGALRVVADEDIHVGSAASIDLRGAIASIGPGHVAADGGQLTLRALGGDVSVAAGAQVDVSGIDGDPERSAAAGGVTVVAQNGAFEMAPAAQLLGAGAPGGSFDLDVDRIGDIDGLNLVLNDGGFTERRRLRIGEGDITLTKGVRARDVSITADGGSLTVAGTIGVVPTGDPSADSVDGLPGRIALAALGDLNLEPAARLDASSPNDGGSVYLLTRDGQLNMAAGSLIRTEGANGAASGYVRLTAPRTDSGDVAVTALAGDIIGAERIDIEATARYDASADGLVSTQIAVAKLDVETFMAGSDLIKQRLVVNEDARFHVIPGVEVVSSGDLVLDQELDLFDWRAGGESGVLALRAGGDLRFDASLSDGFAVIRTFDFTGGRNRPVNRVRLMDDASWSYQLTAGAVVASPDRLATRNEAHSVTVGNDVMVRTGTGNIDIAASGDINLATATSAVYTAGRDGGVGDLDKVTFVDGLGDEYGYGRPYLMQMLREVEFPVEGGDLRLAAGGSVKGAPLDQLYSEWLVRLGGEATSHGAVPTYWGITFQQPRTSNADNDVLKNNGGLKPFRQGFAALGGGDVVVQVGGDLIDASFSIPTTGKAQGEFAFADRSQLAGGNAGFLPSNWTTEINGGGRMVIDVAGDVSGGAYYLGRGTGRLRAGGNVGDETGFLLAVGDAQFDVIGAGDVTVAAMIDPLMIDMRQQDRPNSGNNEFESFMFGYTEASAAGFTSLAGNVIFTNAVRSVERLDFDTLSRELVRPLGLYPGNLTASALAGDINLKTYDEVFYVFPAAAGALSFLAGNEFRSIVNPGGDSKFNQLVQSDGDLRLMPLPANPWSRQEFTLESGDPSNGGLEALLKGHALQPVSGGDAGFNLIATGAGNITDLSVTLSKATRIEAAGDLVNTTLRLQHANATDVSSIATAGTFVQPTRRDANGKLETGGQYGLFELYGPGRAYFTAGGDIDLGTSVGVRSLGNAANANLTDEGMDVVLMAGLSTEPAYDAFIQRYLAESSDYQLALASYVERFGGVGESPLDAFRGFDPLVQRELVLDVFFNELKESGIAATTSNNDFSRGFDAIDTLFPADDYTGDVRSLLSQIATIDQGDVALVVPGGLINAGVAGSSAISKGPDQLGIVAAAGNVSGFADGDFLVNQSRVFALSGDLLLWSSNGDLDAGRGAKTAVSIPPPRTVVDQDGNVTVEFPPAVAGSGLLGKNAYLFAPKGVIDAGDAGIRATENLTIAATEVIGADNIDVGGFAVGVPVGDSSIAAGLTGVSGVASSVTKDAESSLASNVGSAADQASETPLSDQALSFLEVVVEGFGLEDVP